MTNYLMQNYARAPISFEKGAGAWLWDTDGKKYFDALTGIAVCSLGHAHPQVTAAIQTQAETLVHTSNLFRIPNQERLAEKLCRHAGMENAFFANSGAEANEAAIKLARLYGQNKGVSTPTIITMQRSFHGRTMATLSATGNPAVHNGFAPLVANFVHIPFDDVAALAQAIADNQANVVAVMLEPVQGEGGIHIPQAGYLTEVRALCDQHDLLMIMDEIQAGMCRTGQWFGYQHDNVLPDIVTLAKALGNGAPIGACLAQGKAAALFAPGHHGSTYGGNPLACAAALAVVETMEQDNIVTKVQSLATRVMAGFTAELGDLDGVQDMRNQGLMIAIELAMPCTDLFKHGLDNGIVLNVTQGNIIRLLPPLNMTDDEADYMVANVAKLVQEFLA